MIFGLTLAFEVSVALCQQPVIMSSRLQICESPGPASSEFSTGSVRSSLVVQSRSFGPAVFKLPARTLFNTSICKATKVQMEASTFGFFIKAR